MKRNNFYFLFFSFLFILNINAQWVKTSYPSTASVESMTSCGNTIMVGSKSEGIYISNDNGQTWLQKNNGLPAYLNEVSSVACDGSTFYATIIYSGFYISNDGGNNWTEANNGLPNAPYIKSFVFSGNDLFVGCDSGVYHSSDNGANWTAVNNGLTDLDVRALGIIGQYIFVSTYSDGLFRSPLNSINWTKVNNGLPSNEYVRCFTEISGKIFIGTTGGVYYSDNNGDLWNAANNGIGNEIITSLAVSGNYLFATLGSGDGGVMYSGDLGNSWHPINDGFPTYPYARAVVVNDSYVFAGGPEDAVWKRPLSQVTSVNENDIPLGFKLSQNFPNPFGESSPSGKTNTTIKYTIPASVGSNLSTDTKLVVYDILGREILTLVNKPQNSGEYKIDFDVSSVTKDIPSGVYFYKLQAGKFIDVKKMILLR